jgi:hypothetical protein
LQKNVAGQKWIVFAFNRTTNVPLSGDAANITANLRLDGGAANPIDDTNPTELEDGYYVFNLTQVETDGENIVITPVSGTADIQVIGVPGAVYTTPANYPDLSIEINGDITKVATTTTNTDMRGTNSALLAASVNIVAGIIESNLLKIGGVTQSATDLKDFADSGYDPVTNKIEGVKLADVTTLNSDMRGTNGANTVTPNTVVPDAAGVAAGLISALNNVSSAEILTTALTEAYAADGSAATLSQLLYMIWSILNSLKFVTTTGTARELDGVTPAMTFTIDDADNPTDINRTG